ncbi:hypothetical protein BsWGS_16976 [Bradybaena similaris]
MTVGPGAEKAGRGFTMAEIKCGVRVLPPLPGDIALRNVQNTQDAQEQTRPKKPPLPKKPQPPSSALKPQTPSSALKPQPPSSALKPKPPSSALKPQPPSSALKPQPPSSALKPQPPSSALKPQPPSSALKPQPPSSALKPQPPSSALKPQPPSSALKPTAGQPPRPVDLALVPASAPPLQEPNRRKPPPPTKSWLEPQAMAQSGDAQADSSLVDRGKPLITPRTSSPQHNQRPQQADPSRVSDPLFEEPAMSKRPVPKPRTVKQVVPSTPPRRRGMSDIPEQSFESDKVMVLSDDNFEEFTQNMGKSLVLFYNSTKPDTDELTNEFSDAAEKTQEPMANFGAVDCSQDQELCYRQGACSTPMLKLYSDGSHLNNIKDPDVFKAVKMETLIRLAPAIIFQHWSNTERPVPKPRKNLMARQKTSGGAPEY